MGKTVRGAVVLAWIALLIPACNSTSPDGTGTPPPAPPVGLNQPPTVRIVTPVPGAVLQEAELNRERDELLLSAVMQVALDPLPFLILGLDQPPP